MPSASEFEIKSGWPVVVKSAALGFLGFIIALGSGWELKEGRIAQACVLLAVFLIVFVLQTVFLSRGRLLYLLTLIESLGLAFFFYRESANYIILGSFIFLLLSLLYSIFSAKKDLEMMMKVGFYRLSSLIASQSLVGLSVFISAVYFFGGVVSFSPQAVAQNFTPISSAIKYYYPAYDLSTSTISLFQSIAKEDLPSTGLTQYEESQAISQMVAKEEAAASHYLGGAPDLNQSIVKNVANFLFDRFTGLAASVKTLLGLAGIFLVILSVRSLGFVIYPVISLFSFLIFQLLTALNFAKIDLEDKSQEVIKLI